MLRSKIVTAVAAAVLAASFPSQAQVPPDEETKTAPAPKPKPKSDFDIIQERLSSGNADEIAKAVAQLHEIMTKDPKRVLDMKSNSFLERLSELGKYSDVDALAVTGIKSRAHQLDIVMPLQQVRVRNLLVQKRFPEALQQAKAYYNVCSMPGTSDAILLMMEVLRTANPDDMSQAETFKKEQISGAEPSTAESPVPQTVLASIQLTSDEYNEAIRQRSYENYGSLSGRGNLLLLSDKPDEAKKAFEQAYELADDKQLAGASESLARAMRAKDGSIARANAFVLSLRPKLEKPTTQPAKN